VNRDLPEIKATDIAVIVMLTFGFVMAAILLIGVAVNVVRMVLL
jgi:hypothetical protein